ncbi:hypothetical protein C9374_012708 [Naegleria lovaniensis]|uniref:Uncharacterized protein n=1 Tax=Naegleria lovaniensis TaxID=51637 RepID=A0AA88H3X1_NAELO|nr:uncharacterized protein C9374_012708 [Naegleria lovaniensis]KAG2392456.1 hypothetical protein C9374_012708 [Naegleria lovaniensis]
MKNRLLAGSCCRMRNQFKLIHLYRTTTSTQLRFVRTELAVGEEKADQRFDGAVNKSLKGEATSTVPEFEKWNETLASSSEAIVKAERSHDMSKEELQEQTIKTLQEMEKKGEFPFDDTQ